MLVRVRPAILHIDISFEHTTARADLLFAASGEADRCSSGKSISTSRIPIDCLGGIWDFFRAANT